MCANGPGDRGSTPGRVIPKTLKMVLDASLLNTQQYKVHIESKVEQSRESSRPRCSSYWKRSLRSPSTTVTNFTYLFYNCLRIIIAYIYSKHINTWKIRTSALNNPIRVDMPLKQLINQPSCVSLMMLAPIFVNEFCFSNSKSSLICFCAFFLYFDNISTFCFSLF